MRKTDTAKRQYPFDGGAGWYIVEGLGSFGTTAEDFTGPYATHQEALDKLESALGMLVEMPLEMSALFVTISETSKYKSMTRS